MAIEIPSLPVEWREKGGVDPAAVGEYLLDTISYLVEVDQELELLRMPMNRRVRRCRHLVEIAGDEIAEALLVLVERDDGKLRGEAETELAE